MTVITHAAAGTEQRDGETIDLASLVHEVERVVAAGIGITSRAIDETAAASELTLAQWRVLVVAGAGDGARIGELASHLGMSVPSASRLVRRVEARGLVTATRALDDRRATDVCLTPAGRKLVAAVVGRRRALIRQALDGHIERRPLDELSILGELADRLAAHA
jgi:DNA-binding MarR family transcriptional regulator